MRDSRWPDLLTVLFFCALALALLWPLPLHPGSTVPDLGDPLDSAWRLSWPVHQLLHDPLHFFDANIFYPVKTTYLFDELILGVAILVAPVTLLSSNGILSFNVALFLAFAGNGLAMYALGRRLTGNRWAALLGGIVYMAAPFRFQHVGHIGLSTAAWMPLTLLFLDRLLERHTWRDAGLFGACVALQALSSQYYGFQIAFVIAIYLLYALVRWRHAVINGPFLVRLFVATVFAELLLFPVVAPYTAVKATWGYTRGLAENELFSATLTSFLATPTANYLGWATSGVLRAVFGARSWNVWLYPGLGALVIATCGLLRPVRETVEQQARRVARATVAHAGYGLTVVLALFGALMALGPVLYPQAIGQNALTRVMPYRFFFEVIPVFDAMRAPERFGNVLLLGLAGAVSFGATALLARVPTTGRRSRSFRTLVALGLLVAVSAEYVRAPLRPAQAPPPPPVYSWLKDQPRGVTLELPYGVSPQQLNREQVRQYWSTAHWQPRVNGSSDLVPVVFDSLRRDLAWFPDPRSLGLLQGLGVRYVIVHRAQYQATDWPELATRLASYAVTLRPRGEFGDDLAFELQPDDRFTTFQRAIEPGADVFLSGGDPIRTDAYMAMLGRLLPEHRLVSRITPTFGKKYELPAPGRFARYAIVYRTEDPTRYNYPANMPVVYEDNVVRVHRRSGS